MTISKIYLEKQRRIEARCRELAEKQVETVESTEIIMELL